MAVQPDKVLFELQFPSKFGQRRDAGNFRHGIRADDDLSAQVHCHFVPANDACFCVLRALGAIHSRLASGSCSSSSIAEEKFGHVSHRRQ